MNKALGNTMLISAIAAMMSTAALADNSSYINGDVIVKFKTEPRAQTLGTAVYHRQARELLNTLSEANDVTVRSLETDNQFVVVHTNNTNGVESLIQEISKNPDVAYAEPNYIVSILDQDAEPASVIPNDPDFSLNWGLQNVGQKDSKGQEGAAGADIGASQAWAITTGTQDFPVAVIDTGVDYTHDELKDNIFINKSEIPDNGIDDDGNGFVDDVHGWNFYGKTNDPMDDHFHGTHCSGTIGARGDNGIGTAGVAWKVKILPIKFLSSSGSGSNADAIESIKYATKMGVKVMSNSWGGGSATQAMQDAIDEARKAGILFIAAAGNASNNNDAKPSYPASYNLDNVISVAASDNRDNLAKFSNFGAKSVHITAPGVNIYSTYPKAKGNYGTISGTSMATPHVSGALTVLWGANPDMNYQQIKERLLGTVEPVLNFTGKTTSGGRLNLYNALMDIRKDPLQPPPPGSNPKKPGA